MKMQPTYHLLQLLYKLGIKSAAIGDHSLEITFFGTEITNIVSGLPLGTHHLRQTPTGLFIDGVKLK